MLLSGRPKSGDTPPNTRRSGLRWRRLLDAGLARDALYLLRPDSYVAQADGPASVGALAGYFNDHGIRIA